MSVLWSFIHNRWSAPPLTSLTTTAITGKTVLVTGASGGLGLEAARHYARLGAARVILGVRSQSKGESAKKSIDDSLKLTGGIGADTGDGKKVDAKGGAIIDVWIVDLASFASVQDFADRVIKELDTLDIAVLNAAVTKSAFTPTSDGWEETVQVNTLSTVLLALLILPKLKASSVGGVGDQVPRLEFVASRAHQYVKEGEWWQSEPNFLAALNNPEAFGSSSNRYGISKLFLIYCVREIAAITAIDSNGKPSVIVNYTCPGACKSDLAREWRISWIKSLFLRLLQEIICKTTEEGSRTLVFATCLGMESHGKWIHNDRIEE